MPENFVVRAQDHRDRVPADDPPDPPLHLLVAREGRLLLGADRVDVAGLGQRRQPDVELAGALEQLVEEEARAGLAFLLDDVVERASQSAVSSGSMSGSWCLNSSKYMTDPLGQAGSRRSVVGEGVGLEHRLERAAPARVLRRERCETRSMESGSSAGIAVAGRRCPSTWIATAGLAFASRYQRAPRR